MSSAIRIVALDGCTKATSNNNARNIERNFIRMTSLAGAGLDESCSVASIFHAIINIFHDFVLESDHAPLRFPPFFLSVLRWLKRGDCQTHGRSGKFTIEDPSDTASGKNFRRDH